MGGQWVENTCLLIAIWAAVDDEAYLGVIPGMKKAVGVTGRTAVLLLMMLLRPEPALEKGSRKNRRIGIGMRGWCRWIGGAGGCTSTLVGTSAMSERRPE